MKYLPKPGVVSWGLVGAKTAALYYDDLLPLGLNTEFDLDEITSALNVVSKYLSPKAVPYFAVSDTAIFLAMTTPLYEAVLESGMLSTSDGDGVLNKLGEKNLRYREILSHSLQKIYEWRSQESRSNPDYLNRLQECEELSRLVNEGGDILEVRKMATDIAFSDLRNLDYDFLSFREAPMEEPFSQTDQTSPALVLSQLEMVDSSKLTWEQVEEIRQDAKARLRLKRLRTFMFEEFEGKPMAFIEDALGVALEDYRAAARAHGAELRRSVLTLATSEQIFASSLAGFAAFVAGGSAPLSVIVGASAQIAGTAIEVQRVYRTQKEDLVKCPVRYLIDVEDAGRYQS